jgi:hypothetical protein
MQGLVGGLVQVGNQFLSEARADVAAAAQYLLRRDCEFFRCALFVDIGGRASPQAAHGVLVLRLATQDDHRQPRVGVLYIPQHVHPAASRHVDIQHQHGSLGFTQLPSTSSPLPTSEKSASGRASARISLRPRRTTAWSSAIRMCMFAPSRRRSVHRNADSDRCTRCRGNWRFARRRRRTALVLSCPAVPKIQKSSTSRIHGSLLRRLLQPGRCCHSSWHKDTRT